ncbi:Integrin-like protein [Candidatus Koribacter versatilis Ellin345]|uniref:Integrin-like protein n=1 Tax=Koribacter versatilis (strain Ellin345) TaxID=204669 RepID=Q1IPC6_KORVE|nr:VCBS repeat-containing protein [Candidatus Koribacter versatilis]ABF41274.1 Integrin-like protein [Candidatus Koribacter versatilis Ellin345]
MRLLHILAALVVTAAPLVAQVTYSFSNYPTQGPANHMVIADFNRDGYPDMAIVVSNPNVVDVYFNDHTGHFSNYTAYPTGDFGWALALDANGDGWPDILVASTGTGSTTLLLNNGDGTFRTGTAPITKAQASQFVAGDFNKDGKVDLAAIEGNQIEILLNNGNGTFHSGQMLAMAGGTFNAVVADFDGDGNLDISNAESNKFLVWWGKGTGAFAAPLQVPAPTRGSLFSVATADFNNDGLPDLAVSSNYNPGNCDPTGGPCGTTTAHIYKNMGGRSFSHISSYQIGDREGGVLSTADVNGDLNQDIVDVTTAGGVDSGVYSYRPGNGNTTFGAEQTITGGSAFEIVLRDLNHDSRADVGIPSFFPGGEGDVGLATSGYKTCTGVSSASLNAKFCEPQGDANATPSFYVMAGGDSPLGVQRLEIWVDGKKIYQKLGNQLYKKITLSAGRHRLVVVAVDKYVGTASAAEYVNVQ